MAGVSIDQAPNIDLAAIIQGGDEFMKRMQAFKEAKDAAEDAHAKLGIAKDVIAMRDHAARAIEQAKEEAAAMRASAFAEATKTQASVSEWKQQTEAAAQAKHELAQAKHDEAAKKLADADAMHKQAAAKLNDAQVTADKTVNIAQAQAQKIISDAQDQADAMTKQANDRLAQAVATHSDAQQRKAKYEAALAKIQAAANEVG